MAESRIYDLTTATDTIGRQAILDASGEEQAQVALWPHHIVANLPASPVDGFLYFLNVANGNYPTGLYSHDGTGWICVFQASSIALPDWTGAITQELVAGVEYTAGVTGAVDPDGVTLTTNGIVQVVLSNASEYAVSAPTSGFKTGDNGLDDLSASNVRLSITRTGTEYEYTATSRVAL